MAWYGYDRGYTAAYGYGTPYYTYGGTGWGYDAGYYGAGYAPWGWGFGFGAAYDRTYRASPEDSPTYGRGGDRAVRRWARREGYDVGYAIRPERTGLRGGQIRRTRAYDRGYAGDDLRRGFGWWDRY